MGYTHLWTSFARLLNQIEDASGSFLYRLEGDFSAMDRPTGVVV